jgi:hypothetical protein
MTTADLGAFDYAVAAHAGSTGTRCQSTTAHAAERDDEAQGWP